MQQLHDSSKLPKIESATVIILQSKWYREHTDLMSTKCSALLKKAGAKVEIHILPGCLEFALAAQTLVKKRPVDAIICVGVLMKGDTHHYEMILASCALGLQQ